MSTKETPFEISRTPRCSGTGDPPVNEQFETEAEESLDLEQRKPGLFAHHNTIVASS